MQQKHTMKTQEQIQNKIKEVHRKMINSDGAMFTYWLAFRRALEWVAIKDETNERKAK